MLIRQAGINLVAHVLVAHVMSALPGLSSVPICIRLFRRDINLPHDRTKGANMSANSKM